MGSNKILEYKIKNDDSKEQLGSNRPMEPASGALTPKQDRRNRSSRKLGSGESSGLPSPKSNRSKHQMKGYPKQGTTAEPVCITNAPNSPQNPNPFSQTCPLSGLTQPNARAQ